MNLDCPECHSPRTAVTIDIMTGDRDRMCATCGYHWYPAPTHPYLPTCCRRTIHSQPRSQAHGSIINCTRCHQTLLLHETWHISNHARPAPERPPPTPRSATPTRRILMPTTRRVPLRLPAILRARWRDLPRLTSLAHRRLGPRPVLFLTRPAAWLLWLYALAATHAGGRLLAYGSATVSVSGPRMSWPQRARYTAVLTAASVTLAAWILLPLEAAAYAITQGAPSRPAHLLALCPAATFVIEAANNFLRGLRVVPAALTARRMRRQERTPWWEVGNLVAHEDDHVSATCLILTALALSDTAHATLVAIPNTPQMQAAYTRLGFIPGPLNPRVLIRRPHPTPPGHAQN